MKIWLGILTAIIMLQGYMLINMAFTASRYSHQLATITNQQSDMLEAERDAINILNARSNGHSIAIAENRDYIKENAELIDEAIDVINYNADVLTEHAYIIDEIIDYLNEELE